MNFLKNYIFCSLVFISLVFNNNIYAQDDIDSLIQASKNKSLTYKQRIQLNYSIYDSYERHEMFAKGKPYLDIARQLALNNADLEAYADTKMKLGTFFLMSDNHVEAQRLQNEALEIYKAENKLEKASIALMYLGLIFYEKKDLNQALFYYNESIQYAQQANPPTQAFTSRYLKALALTEKGDLDEAYSIFKIILSQPDSNITLQRRMETLVGIGNIFMKRNLFDSAAYYYKATYKYFDVNNNISAIAYAGSKLADAYLKQNKIDSSLSIAKRCYIIADSINNNNIKFSSSKVISEALVKKGNYKEAYYFLNIYDSLRDVVYNDSTEKKLYNFRVTSQQNEINAKTKYADQQKNLKNAFIVGFTLALLLLIVSLLSIMQNRKKNIELKRSNIEVQQALTQLQETQEQLIRQEKLASLGKMVAGIAHEIQNPLNFVNNFSDASVLLAKDFVNADPEERTQLLNEIVENMNRIKDHGMRASGIVKNMLLYGHSDSFDKQKIDINNMLKDFIPIAYEGLHATNPDFKCRIEKNLGTLPLIECSSQDISRVFLNLLANAFYAVNEKQQSADTNYDSVVSVTTFAIDGGIKILIGDNGTGIPDHLKEKIFEPFFTTKPSGKGIGLGLSLSYDIIKAHGGMLNVKSKVGIFTEFIITLPIA